MIYDEGKVVWHTIRMEENENGKQDSIERGADNFRLRGVKDALWHLGEANFLDLAEELEAV